MSAALAAPPRPVPSPADGRAGRRRVGLGERLTGALDAARAGAPAECPVCGGRMASAPGGVRCSSCRSTIT